MEEVKKYGNLNESEFYDFLREIEEQNDNLQEKEEEAQANEDSQNDADEVEGEEVELNSGKELKSKLQEEPWGWASEFITENSEDIIHEVCKVESAQDIAKKEQMAREFKLRKIEIQRAAFNQEFIDLSKPIEENHYKLLIKILTSNLTGRVEYYEQFLNERIARLLMPFVPKTLKRCFKRFPQSIKTCPGFIYKASEEYGQSQIFYAAPNIPYYFEQGTEMTVLRNMPHPEFLFTVDKAVVRYNYNRDKLFRKEATYAGKLIRLRKNTYFELLKYKPVWFEKLYNGLSEKPLI